MEKSRYGHYHNTKVRRHTRSRVVPGSFENRNRYYRCWNCGFVFDRNQVTTGLDSESRYQTEGVYTGFPVLSGDPLSVQIVWERPVEKGTMMELGPDGVTPKTLVAIRIHHAGPGCPACGTTNLP